jgi:hypothetical protein
LVILQRLGLTVQNNADISTLALLECASKTEIQPSIIPKINYSRISTDRDLLEGGCLLFVLFVTRPTNTQGSSGFYINTFQIIPLHVSAYGCHP